VTGKNICKSNTTPRPGAGTLSDFFSRHSHFQTVYKYRLSACGANWKSEKGYKLGLFYLKDRANSINKEEFDFIAVIDPEAMQKEFIFLVC
jgi:hypothetical protein